MRKKPVLLCILDGWGIGENGENNAISVANTPNYDRFLQQYSNSKIATSGLDVGLPAGQMGNSEVGHMTIGAGRVIYQDLVRINKAIEDGELAKNRDLVEAVSALKKSGKALHLAGLLSDGGVHCHQDHMIFLANFFIENGVKVFLHAFLDGRDVAQKSALGFYEKFVEKTAGKVELASVSGRYYAMDRDNKWDRIKLAHDAIVKGEGAVYGDFSEMIDDCYGRNITDEFVEPTVFGGFGGVSDGDAFLFCNFRADRARQLSQSLLDDEFCGFEKVTPKFSYALAMTQYSCDLAAFYKILFPVQKIENSLPEILAKNDLAQLRIAETEKYAHVTFFFSCGRENNFAREERILIDSVDVATYDLKPEMSAGAVGEKLVKAIESQKFDFIVVNYANPDMVGHSGNLEASIEACGKIDEQLGLLESAILKAGGVMLMTADHGNIECMEDEKGNPHTAHTTNLVPLILVGDGFAAKLCDGNLSDIAPTVLGLLELEKPVEMTGKNLIL